MSFIASFTLKTPMCADECLRDSNPEQLIHDLTAYLEPSLCERWSMQIFKWRIHNPPRVDMIHLLIKSSAQLAKPCNADLGGIPKVEKLRRGQFKSWKCKWSFAEKIEWGKPSITVGLIFTISICTTKSCYGLKYHVKTNIVSPAKNFAFLANYNKKVLDFTVELSSYVHTNIKLLNWRWRRSKKYFILIETYNETKLNIFVELNPIVLLRL